MCARVGAFYGGFFAGAFKNPDFCNKTPKITVHVCIILLKVGLL